MKNIQKFLASTKVFALALSLVMVLTQCSEEEEFLTPSAGMVASEEVDTTVDGPVASISISGAYTEMRENIDCATCTFVVAKGTTLVDGTDMAIKPGSVICLDKGVVYSSLEFTNMEGTESDPIVIGYCSN